MSKPKHHLDFSSALSIPQHMPGRYKGGVLSLPVLGELTGYGGVPSGHGFSVRKEQGEDQVLALRVLDVPFWVEERLAVWLLAKCSKPRFWVNDSGM